MSNETSPFLTADTLAPLSIGSSLNLVLFTLEVVQATQYFRSSARSRDSVFLKLAVSANLLADLVGTAACCATNYLYTTTYWGDVEAIKEPCWPLIAVVFAGGVALAVSQFFMIGQYWQMSRHHFVFALLLITLLAAATGIFGSGVLMALSLNVQSNPMWLVFMFLALIASVVGTVLVSPLLFWQLSKRNDTSGKYILGTLVETGTPTAVVTIITCFTLAFGPTRETMVWVPFAFILARVYSCTTLFVLNRRPTPASALANILDVPGAGPSKRPVGMMVFNKPPVTVMDDTDAFRISRKKIEIDSDSSSDVSRNLNEELADMEDDEEEVAGSRKESFASSRASISSIRDQFEVRSDSPSEYCPSPEYCASPEPEPQSPRVPWGSSPNSPLPFGPLAQVDLSSK
ncbi:hypothetical protein DFH08DRAFT_959083 [Mycena albidolilacea]|uniref:DUF6534 domain-containing protein n=1 Tax=Mycena albidolilacea TaxID=1033008 RepID=A0AAD7EU12_9AGAR|nr:hypothetical protein DFH08DRAFT_959083 [Mycena albidolilacea]